MIPLPDGKLYVLTYNRGLVIRLNEDGTVDTDFDPDSYLTTAEEKFGRNRPPLGDADSTGIKVIALSIDKESIYLGGDFSIYREVGEPPPYRNFLKLDGNGAPPARLLPG